MGRGFPRCDSVSHRLDFAYDSGGCAQIQLAYTMSNLIPDADQLSKSHIRLLQESDMVLGCKQHFAERPP